jgi:hypothetical protein
MTATDATPLPPGDRQRFTDPAADPVYAAINSLDLASQHDILRQLQVKLHAEDVAVEGSQKTRVGLALTALGEAKRRLERSPSIEEYRKLYREGMRDAGWPDDRCIRRWLGGASWNDALRRAHLEPHADGDVVVFQHGHFYTREELIAALRECRDDLEHLPSYPEYVAWANRPDVRTRPGRRPKSIHPIVRLCGSWLGALRAAELIPSDEEHGIVSLLGLRRAEYRVSEDAMRAALNEAAERIGRSPRVQEYLRERIHIYEESSAERKPRALPGYGTFNRRFREWDDALEWAGLERLGGRATGLRAGPRGPQGPRVSTETIRQAIRAAYKAEGDPFTVHAYRLWREEQIEGLTKWERERYPGYHTIWGRYGTWAAACADALGSSSDPDDDPDDDPGAANEPVRKQPRPQLPSSGNETDPSDELKAAA